MKTIIMVSILSLVHLSPLYSGENLWTSVGGPPGGYSRAADFCPLPFTELYASSDSFLYVSTDNGLTWYITDHPKTEFYDIKIGRLGTTYSIFTATSDGIYRCINGGPWWLTNWQVSTLRLAIDRNNCDYIYAITGGRIIRSTNLGETWVEITPQPPNKWGCLEIDHFSPQTLYASHFDVGLWKSVDAGNSWEYLRFADTTIYDIDVSPRNPLIVFSVLYAERPSMDFSTMIWKSEDGGISWTNKLSLSSSCERLTQLIISRPSPDTIFSLYNGKLGHSHTTMFLSYNEGENWGHGHYDWPFVHIDNLYSSPILDGLFIGTGVDGLFKFPNFLNSYDFIFIGFRPRNKTTMITAGFSENYLISDGSSQWSHSGPQRAYRKVWRTRDGGINWTPFPASYNYGEYTEEVRQVEIVSPDSVFLLTSNYKLQIERFYISSDQGTHYNLVFSVPSTTNTYLCRFDVYQLYTIYLIHRHKLFRSEYPFSHWHQISATLPPIYALKIHPHSSYTLFFGGENGGFWKSTDGGQTLILSNTGLPTQDNMVSAIATGFSTQDKPITLYCGFKKTTPSGIAGLYKSTDLGATWQFTGLSEEINEIKVDPYDPSIIYLSTPENIYVSHNFAEDCMALNQGLNGLKTFDLDLSTVRPHLFCGTRHGVFKFSPINLYSGTPIATGYQSCKIVIKENIVHLAYQTQGGVYFGTSDMAGQKKIRKFGMKDGSSPTIAVGADGNPCAIWQRNIEPTPMIGGGELWFSKYDGTNWTEPYLLASFTGPFNLDVNLPSFTINQATNTGYVVFEWRDRYMDGPTSHLYLGWFSINNPSDIQFRELEFALAPARCEFPSISQGSNYLYIAFQREDKIYRIKWDLINHQIVDRTRISAEDRFSRHPYCDVQTNGVINYVWEDSTVGNIEIYWCWEIPGQEPSMFQNVSQTPGKSQWPQICKGTTWITWSEFIYPPTDNNWEICYKDLEFEGYQILSQTLEMSKFSHGVITRSPYWPPPYEPKLTAIWTEGNQPPFEIRSKTVAIPAPYYFYVNAGKEEPSPLTVQREGYIQFAPEPEKTIDYHPTKLIYRFPNLNPERRYRIKLVFYFESQSPTRWRMKIDGDNIFHANTWVKSGEIGTFERWLPSACYKDGEVYLNITKISGDYAFVAQVFLYEYERETEAITKSLQESESLPATEPVIFISPNPVRSVATISYLVPQNHQQPISLKIYDSAGRLIRQYKHLTNSPFNQITWDGTDENGKILSAGIYFIVLENSKNNLMRKIVLIR